MKNIEAKAERKISWRCLFLMVFLLNMLLAFPGTAGAHEPLRVEFFYQEVCATCDGTEEFYEIYDNTFSSQEKAQLNVEIATYNVFLESNEEHYRQVAGEKGIPEGTSLPVLVAGDQWVSGYDAIEDSLKELLQQDGGEAGRDASADLGAEDPEQSVDGSGTQVQESVQEDSTARVQAAEAQEQIRQEDGAAMILFTTNACEECESVKEWISGQEWLQDTLILEYNIIEDNSLDFLKKMFRNSQVEEDRQEVPSVFAGDAVLTGTGEIRSITEEQLDGWQNEDLIQLLETVQEDRETEELGGEDAVSVTNLLTLAGAGLLAGFNPCSISMLLMLLSLILGAKASVLKSGLMYLLGKYAAYFAIGMAIYLTASQVSEDALNRAGRIIDLVLAVLFLGAAVFYAVDAVKIFRKDYGHIRTQLPVGLRKANHNLIRKISGMSGLMQPLLILGLGIAIAFGEFFCTGQIYMASITYMLRDGEAIVCLPFIVYVTAMSLPAVCMILLIQKTRNTDRISEFMFRHLGAIKVLNAVLFICFALYFLLT